MGHYIPGDIYVSNSCKDPRTRVQKKARGVKSLGIAYENAVGALLGPKVPHLHHGPWFKFTDRRGTHYCQPDFIFGYDGVLWVLEVKHSLVESGFRQMEELYLPVLRKAYGVDVIGVQVCKNLARLDTWEDRPKIFGALAPAMDYAGSLIRPRAVWHWQGLAVTGAQLPGAAPEGIDNSGKRASSWR